MIQKKQKIQSTQKNNLDPLNDPKMTGQIHDLVNHDGEEYSLVGQETKSGNLFFPRDYGFTASMISTGCYRGSYCTYSILDGKLFLTHLVINHVPRGATDITPGPKLDGQDPLYENRRTFSPDEEPPKSEYMRGKMVGYSYKDNQKIWSITYDGLIYTNIRVPMSDFTGTLQIGKDFNSSSYIHMGFQSATAYGTVLNVIVEKGKVISIENFNPTPTSRDSEPGWTEDVGKWIDGRFSLDIPKKEG